jgi:hypothetical protein
MPQVGRFAVLDDPSGATIAFIVPAAPQPEADADADASDDEDSED